MLKEARLLLVPGGWPALKYKALGPAGARAVRDFVEQGGFYLGLCGGAGLALKAEHGLGLIDLGRAPAGRKISGPQRAGDGGKKAPRAGDHAMWSSLPSPAQFHVWWPGQTGLSRKAGRDPGPGRVQGPGAWALQRGHPGGSGGVRRVGRA